MFRKLSLLVLLQSLSAQRRSRRRRLRGMAVGIIIMAGPVWASGSARPTTRRQSMMMMSARAGS